MILAGVAPGRDPDRHPPAGGRQRGPHVRRRRRRSTAPRSGITGRVTGLLVGAEGTLTFTVGGGAGGVYPATFTIVRVGPTGALDPTFGGTGIVTVALGPGQGAGIGAAAIRQGPSGTTLVAGTDLTAVGHAARRGDPAQAPTARWTRASAANGVARVARAGREIRIKAMARDSTRPDPARRLGPAARGARDAPARRAAAATRPSATAA